MAESEPSAAASEPFSVKLRRLFDSVKREDGSPYSKPEVAEAIGTSRGYLYDLLGGKYGPGYPMVLRLAEFFGVELEFFADSEKGRELNRQYELLARLGENNVNRLATRASQLSPDKLRSVMEYIDFQAREDQGDTRD